MKSLAVCIASLTLVLGVAGVAHASCVPQPSLSESIAASSVAFTGTVTAVGGGDRIATVIVDEVWKGGPLPSQVQVHGGPSDPRTTTSVDRTYEQGDKYLFVPVNDESPFQDNICSATQEYSPQLENSRPLDSPASGGVTTAPKTQDSRHPGPSQTAKALIFALALGVSLAAGYALKGRANGGG